MTKERFYGFLRRYVETTKSPVIPIIRDGQPGVSLAVAARIYSSAHHLEDELEGFVKDYPWLTSQLIDEKFIVVPGWACFGFFLSNPVDWKVVPEFVWANNRVERVTEVREGVFATISGERYSTGDGRSMSGGQPAIPLSKSDADTIEAAVLSFEPPKVIERIPWTPSKGLPYSDRSAKTVDIFYEGIDALPMLDEHDHNTIQKLAHRATERLRLFEALESHLVSEGIYSIEQLPKAPDSTTFEFNGETFSAYTARPGHVTICNSEGEEMPIPLSMLDMNLFGARYFMKNSGGRI